MAWPDGLQFSFDAAPDPAVRAALAQAIHGFHARTVAPEQRRFALSLRQAGDELVAGLCGVVSWQWLFVEAVWVADDWRGRRIGAGLMQVAEAHAARAGCHSVWLDTFQAAGFYRALGYETFAALEDYPPGHSRVFLRKRLVSMPNT